MAKAVTGVEAIYLVQVGAGTEQAATVIKAARSAGVQRIVLQSSVGARLMAAGPDPARPGGP